MASTKLSTGLSVGSWQELALVRQGSALYIYHNGLRVGSASTSAVLNNKVTFHFGASSRAYSMIDELRLLNFPVVKGGASYTPTAVPYDTNSVLILPDGTVPVADEYWKWDRTISPAFSLDMTTGYLEVPSFTSSGGGDYYWNSVPVPGAFYCASGTGVTVYDGFSRMYIQRTPSRTNMQYSDSNLVIPAYNLALYVGQSVLNPSTQYTATFVSRDLTRYSFTFDTLRAGYTGTSQLGDFDWGYADYVSTWNNSGFLRLRARASSGFTLDFIYVEIVPGAQANTGHEFVTCLYPADEMKPNTAAVQSDIPINGYTVGGVRPTFPQRGDVWFPVNGSRISGCYIYNGRAWEETNARWYTGKRWIPIYAFDIITLEDMWDIADAPDVVPSINSEQGFWNWWQSAWLDFRSWLSSAWGSGSGGSSGGGGGSVDDSTFEPVPPPGEDPESSGWSFLDLLVAIKDGAWSITVGTVKAVFGGVSGVITAVGSIDDYYNAYDSDNPDGIFGITNYEGADIWD